MSWFNNLFSSRVDLSTTDRQTIWKLFGSFQANKIGSNQIELLRKGYESNVDVYSVITKTYEVFNSIPKIVERKTSEGWEIEENTTIHDLWEAPNRTKGYTWDDIDTQRIIYLLANGNSYLLGEKGLGSQIAEVDVLPSPSITINTGNDFFIPNVSYQFNLNSQIRNYDSEELQQIKLFNPLFQNVQEAQYGLSIIQVAARAVQVSNDRWEADANLLQNRGAIGMITDSSERPMTENEAEKAQTSFDNQTTGPNKFGRIKVTNKDLKFVQMAMSSADLQILEKGVIPLRALCNVMGYDSSLFNDPANKTYNNRNEAEKSMYTNVIIPLANKFDAQDTRFIAQNHYPDGSRRIRHDFSEVEALQKDKKTEAEKDKIVMEGVNIVLNMPVSDEAKQAILISEYNFSEDMAQLMTTTNEGL